MAGHERPPAPRPDRSGWVATLAVAALLLSCTSPTSDNSGTGDQEGGSSGATGTGGLAGRGASGGAAGRSSGGAGGSSGGSSASGSGGSGGSTGGTGGSPYRYRRRVDRWQRRLADRRWRRIDRGSRRLRSGRIDGVRGIARDRGFRRCFWWPGRIGRRGDVWKGRSIWNGRQCRKWRRRNRRQHGDGRHLERLLAGRSLDRRSAVQLEQRWQCRQRLLLSIVVQRRIRIHDRRWRRRQVQRHLEQS